MTRPSILFAMADMYEMTTRDQYFDYPAGDYIDGAALPVG